MIDNANSPDNQHIILFFNLPDCFRGKPALTGRNSTRLQRAPKGSRQSTGCRGYHIIQGCGMWLVYLRIYYPQGDNQLFRAIRVPR